MKIRKGWVSNSSSCSFLVVDTLGKKDDFCVRPPLMIPGTFRGETDFGRQGADYHDLGDKLNFAVLIAGSWDYANFRVRLRAEDIDSDFSGFWKDHSPDEFVDLIGMIRRVLAKEYGDDCDVFIHFDPEDLHYDAGSDNVDFSKDIWRNKRKFQKKDDLVLGYIDHGSNWGESPYNLAIFESEGTLSDFLFRVDSYVANQGDEYDPVPRKKRDGQWCTLQKKKGCDSETYWTEE